MDQASSTKVLRYCSRAWSSRSSRRSLILSNCARVSLRAGGDDRSKTSLQFLDFSFEFFVALAAQRPLGDSWLELRATIADRQRISDLVHHHLDRLQAHRSVLLRSDVDEVGSNLLRPNLLGVGLLRVGSFLFKNLAHSPAHKSRGTARLALLLGFRLFVGFTHGVLRNVRFRGASEAVTTSISTCS